MIAVLLISPVWGQEDYSKWNYSQRIILNTTSFSGAGISGVLFSFPVLIRLNSGNFRYFSQTSARGADIRFSKPDGTHLPYQIDRWIDNTGNNDTAEIWVRVDTISGNSISQCIVMHWGNSTARDSSNSGKVFGTKDQFMGVWHMNDSSGPLIDATTNKYHAIRNGNITRSAGNTGYGQLFDGNGDYGEAGDVLNMGTTDLTISAWVKRTTLNTWQTLVTKSTGGDPSSSYGWHLCFNGNNRLSFYAASGGSSWGNEGSFNLTSSGSVADSTGWHHVAVVIDRSGNDACKMYIDGSESTGTILGDVTSLGDVSNSVNFRIGAESDDEFFLRGYIDEITIANSLRSAGWIKLCYENQKPSQTLVTTGGRLWWDSTVSPGIQAGSGIWGSNAFWAIETSDGRTLTTWPGSPYTAAFGGSKGNYTVTLSGTQKVDSILFETSTYTLKGGTLNFGSIPGVIRLKSSDISAAITSVISGSGVLTLHGGGSTSTGSNQSTLTLSGLNSYSGATILTSHIRCNVDTLTDGGKNSSLGASTSNASNLILDAGIIRHTGRVSKTDRLFTVTANGGALYSSGSGALSFTSTGTVVFSGSGARVLEFGGNYTQAPNTFAPLLQDGTAGATSVVKTGVGNAWVFTGTHTYTGATTVKEGSLIVNGTIGAGSAVTVASGATLGGNGTIKGTVSAAGIISPGNGGAGKLRTGPLTLSSSSNLNFESGTTSDTLIIDGDFTLDGTLNVTATAGFSFGTCHLASWSGKLTNDTIVTGILPVNGTLQLTDSTLSIFFPDTQKVALKITSQPQSQISKTGDSTGFSVAALGNSLSYAWKKIGSDSVLSDKSSLSIRSVAFADSGRFFCLVSDSKMTISTDTVSLIIINDTMVNPLTVIAKRLEKKIVQITLHNIDNIDTAAPAPAADSIGLWITAGALPRSAQTATLVKTYRRQRITGSTLLDTIIFPDSNSLYGIMSGLFFNNGTVTAFLAGNGTLVDLRDTVPIEIPDTPDVTDTLIKDCIRITDLHYDSLRSSLQLSWCVDTAKYAGELEIGITYSLKQFPVAMSGKQTMSKVTPCTDTLVILNEPLQPDTTYYVSLFIRKPGESWIAGGEMSRDTARTGWMSRQVITYFNDSVKIDSIPLFKGQVILWKDSTYNNSLIYTDTLSIYQSRLPEGFIRAGTAVSFSKAAMGSRFFVGFRVNVPDSFTLADVRIFRDSGGVMLVEHRTFADPASGIVYVTTQDIGLPFLPLIDTCPARVSFRSQLSSVANPEQDLFDTAAVIDNVANARWWYLYSKADQLPLARDSGTLSDTSTLCKLLISKNSHVINSESGFRALFVLTDGTFIDTFDLSRQVYRTNSDPFVTVSNRWQPFYPTAELDVTDPESLIVRTISKDNLYDTRYLRLFRWVGVNANRNDEQKWVEYNPDETAVRSLFILKPGRMLWLKTRQSELISFGTAKTLSLKDTFTIKLPPEDFTDFGMPYRFGVTIRDILAASGDKAGEIYILQWHPDKATGQFKCEVMYASHLSGYNDASMTLNFVIDGGYSFYNPSKDTVVLRIPSTLATDGNIQKLSKKPSDKNWCARLIATEQSGYAFPIVNCGYAEGLQKSNFPLPPSFSKTHLYIFDRTGNLKQGHYLCDTVSEGIVKEVRFANGTDSIARISFRFETAGLFPKGFLTHLYDNGTKSFLSEGSIDVPAQTTVSRWLTIGDNGLRTRFLTASAKYTCALHRIFPNPAHGKVTIAYSIPVGFENHLNIAIFDLQGRIVWDTKINHLLPEGNHTVTWDGKRGSDFAGAGIYVIRMAIVNTKGKTVEQFDRRITYLP